MWGLMVMLCRKLGLIRPSAPLEGSCPRWCVEAVIKRDDLSSFWEAGGALDSESSWNNPKNWTSASAVVEAQEVALANTEPPRPPDAV